MHVEVPFARLQVGRLRGGKRRGAFDRARQFSLDRYDRRRVLARFGRPMEMSGGGRPAEAGIGYRPGQLLRRRVVGSIEIRSHSLRSAAERQWQLVRIIRFAPMPFAVSRQRGLLPRPLLNELFHR